MSEAGADNVPRVFIPPQLRSLTDGHDVIEVNGGSVRQLIDAIDAMYPGIKDRLCPDGELKPGLTVAVDGNVTSIGLLQKTKPDSEVHFLPAIGGG